MKYQVNIIFSNINKNIVLENNIINRDKILELINELEINNHYKVDNYLIYNGSILSNNEPFKIENNDIFFCNKKISGGFSLGMFDPLFQPMFSIGKAFIALLGLTTQFIKIFTTDSFIESSKVNFVLFQSHEHPIFFN